MSKLPEPGPIARRAAADALLPGNLSVREEGGNNRGKWVRAYLAVVGIFEPAPWCMAWAVTRLVKAAQALGAPLPKGMPKTGYTPTFADWAKNNDLWIPVADADRDFARVRRGDLAFFYFASKGRIAHVGIVVEVHPGGVMTVEGNTGPDAGGHIERDGDGVHKKWRSWREIGKFGGFARIPA